MVIPGYRVGSSARDLQVFCQETNHDSLVEHFERFSAAVLMVGGIEAIPSLVPDINVTDVSVSFVMPEQLLSPVEFNASFH
jgi:hypothetical protein